MKYKHLSQKERDEIYIMIEEGKNNSEIGKIVGRPASTILREQKRNRTSIERRYNNSPKKKKYVYLPDRAQEKYEKRRKEAKSPYPLKNPFIYQYSLEGLKRGWSPEQISGRLKKKYGQEISPECIYQFIYGRKAKEKGLRLWEYLPRAHRKRRKRTGRKTRRVLIPNRKDIALRPEVVGTRERYGDFEGDTIFGRGQGAALATINERKSRYLFIRKLKRKTAEEMQEAVNQIFKTIPKGFRHTLTLDNGVENVKHAAIAEAASIDVYFARPYHSWERGGNEWLNGIVRRYYPKKTNFDELSEEELQQVEALINSRPMKCLDWNTPHEIFSQQLNILSPHSIKNCT